MKSLFIFLLLFPLLLVAEDLQELIKLSEEGDANSQNSLAIRYENGDGVEQDYEKAAHLYTQSAEQGNVYAQFNLALMYDYGKGIPEDEEEAIKWYTKAAEQGDEDAQENLDILLNDGPIYTDKEFWLTVLDAVDMLAIFFPALLFIILAFVFWKNRNKDAGRYSTFLPRFCALFVDVALIEGTFEICMLVFNIGETAITHLLYGVIVLSYAILLHGYNGQTIGKKIFRIRVVDMNEERLGYLRAFRRDVVLVILLLLQFVTYPPSFEESHESDQESSAIESVEQGYANHGEASNEDIDEDTSEGESVFVSLMGLELLWWILIFFTVVFNEKRRGVHDYVAGSVVVRIGS